MYLEVPTARTPLVRTILGRRYDLYPATTGDGPRPLLVCLHGWGMKIARGVDGIDLPGEWGETFPEHTGLLARTDVHLAFPQADTRVRRLEVWHRDWLDDDATIEFLLNVRVDARVSVPVDDDRIGVAGFSDGCIPADRLCLWYPGLFPLGLVRHSGVVSPALAAIEERTWNRHKPPVFCIAGGDGWPWGPTPSKLFEFWARLFTKKARKLYESHGHKTELFIQPGRAHEWATEANDKIWTYLKV